jgi:carbonic anhydrase
MTKVTDEEVHAELLSRGLDTRSLDFQTVSDQLETLRQDVQKIRSSPYLPGDLAVVGCVYDVATGLLDVAVPHEA